MPDIQEISDCSQDNSSDTNPERQLQLFVKQMLQSRLFIGNFQEKRYVDSLQSYRDVIVIANEETELIRDLEVVKNRLLRFYGKDLWIGITDPEMVGAPAGNCLWVELPDEIFGSYWYKISKARFRPNEVLLRLKVIRPVSSHIFANADASPILKKPSPKKANDNNDRNNDDTSNVDHDQEDDQLLLLQQRLKEAFIAARINIFLFLSTIVTINNTKEAIKFSSVLLAAVLTGAVGLVEYLGNFAIRLLHEMSVFLNAATPIIIACINLIGKTIGGFFLLILGMWRSRKGPPLIYQSPYVNRTGGTMLSASSNSYGYNTVYFKRSIKSIPMSSGNNNSNHYRSSVKITPLD